MTYRTILIHFTDERRVASMLDTALPLARANKAHVVGLCVLPPIIVVPAMDGVPADAIEEHRDKYREQMARMRDQFATATKAGGVEASWQELDVQTENPFGNVAGVVVQRARSADLVIAGQADPKWPLTGLLDVAEPTIIESGRPVLLVPSAGAAKPMGKHILLAWYGSREAARAAFDALPLLAAAERVTVAEIDGHGEQKPRQTAATTEICATLSRHGVRCEALVHRAMTGTGSTLLALARDKGADTLVMGCYGHSRLREFVMGGATRYVLQHTTIPVLMAH